MKSESLNKKVVKATKWSAVTEIVARLVLPISNIVLARILAPEAFGIVATITMVVTFAEVFTDAGFQKYLVQHEFKDEIDKEQSTNVAFWSNLIMSLMFWIIIAVFRDEIARIVGNPGMGWVLVIASVSIPLAAFSSIQMALYKRELDFKTLFKVRIVGVCIPLFVTIPCALILKSFWALVIGIITRDIFNAAILTWYSRWKPEFFYSYAKLKEMFSFSSWSVAESVSIWLTGYADIFLVGSVLNQYYLGLYKTSMTFVSGITGLVTAATTPILFSSLSRLQNNKDDFIHFYLKFQKLVGILVIPLGVIVFCYRDFITSFILGDQWVEAAGFIGLWGLTSSVVIVLSNYASEIYRAKGKPQLSLLSQSLHLLFLFPAMLIAIRYGYETLYTTRALIRFQAIIVDLIIMYYFVRMLPLRLIGNVLPSIFASLLMVLLSTVLKRLLPDTIIFNIVSMLFCGATYLLTLQLFKEERVILKNLPQVLRNK